MKAVVAAFNQEKALVGAFSVITNLRIEFGWNFLKHYISSAVYKRAEVEDSGDWGGGYLQPGAQFLTHDASPLTLIFWFVSRQQCLGCLGLARVQRPGSEPTLN